MQPALGCSSRESMSFCYERMQAADSSSDADSVVLHLEPVRAVLLVAFAPDQHSLHAADLCNN